MENYKLTVNCEYLNDAGILVSHTLRAFANSIPDLNDRYMFIISQHFKPVVIQILNVICTEFGAAGILVCEGEEVDEMTDIKEVFDTKSFVLE